MLFFLAPPSPLASARGKSRRGSMPLEGPVYTAPFGTFTSLQIVQTADKPSPFPDGTHSSHAVSALPPLTTTPAESIVSGGHHMAFDSMAGAMGDAVAVIRQHDKEFECVVGNYGFAEKRRYNDV